MPDSSPLPTPAASTQQAKFRTLLAELFMLDQADLDFGIYRIMNAKRSEITRFLDDDLLPQVRGALGTLEDTGRGAARQELEGLVKTLTDAGMDPEQSPKVRELRARFGAGADSAATEAEVFSHLYQFFRRYYHEGDFLSLRRYKEGVYAIPYEGEEVKLHWANADQYYIKTGEYFRDYTWRLPDGRAVHFRLAEADTERNNNKAAAGQERRFVLAEDEPVVVEDGELTVRFTYRPTESKTKQAALNDAAEPRILDAAPANWRAALAAKAPTDKNAARTLLAKHLADYTARNTFDYFIHKDLGGFLRRELDFYLKNEVMHLDDIENEPAPRVEQYLAKLRAVRRIGHKIIDFLAQLEDFQKRLWLKKKFVVETGWCATLDRVPPALYPEIAANDRQRQEWVRLFAIDEIKGDLTGPGYSVPLSVDFLKANPFLVLDTRFFNREFVDRLLASEEILGDADSLDDATDGLLVHSENFQALMLLQERYRGAIGTVYIDSPYNTGGDGFAYKDAYQHSSWLSMTADRLRAAKELMSANALFFANIDDVEAARMKLLLSSLFGDERFIEQAVWKNKYGSGALTRGFANIHEYALCYSNSPTASISAPLNDEAIKKYKHHDSKFTTRGGYVTQPLATKSKDPRPNLRFPIMHGGVEIWPEKQWVWSRERVEAARANDELVIRERDGKYSVRVKQYLRDETGRTRTGKPTSILLGPFNQEGTKEVHNLFGIARFAFPKPSSLVQYFASFVVNEVDNRSATYLDYFAGSGTTGHAVINLNREDGGSRKYILVEMGEYFDTVLKPRIQKVVYSKDWKDGKPVGREGTSHLFKYLRLESYEDTLNNLALARTQEQQELLDAEPEFREDYTLRYMLDVESRGSQSLLNLAHFDDPFAYTLRIGTGSAGETRETAVDLVETFNYLLGLRVKHIDQTRGVRVVQGTSPEGERVLVLWRNVAETPSDALNDWFRKQGYNTRDQEWDIIYVNGDNHLANLRRPDETWKVRLTEEEFSRRMWDVREV